MIPLIVLLGNDSCSLTALHDLSREAGYRALRCRPCEVTDAHAVLKRAAADLVILDHWTEGAEDGWAFLRHLWADLATTHLPVIVVAGETDILPIDVDVLRTMHCRVVRKPLDARTFRSVVVATLGPQERDSPSQVAPRRMVMSRNALAAGDGGEK